MAKNNVWQWDETAANNSDIAGIDITGATGKVKDGDNAFRTAMSQIITMEGKGTSIASAATLTLSGPERYFHITGNTGPITDIDFTDAVDGRWAWLIFDSTPTLTHNGTTLQLPGNANIVAAAGDRALFVQDSSDNVICLAYVRAAAVPPTTGTFTPTLSASGATFSYASQTGTYTRFANLVYFYCRISLNTSGQTLTSSTLSLAGFPFVSAESTTQWFRLMWHNTTSSYVDLQLSMAAGASSATVVGATAAAPSSITTQDANQACHATNGTVLSAWGVYRVA